MPNPRRLQLKLWHLFAVFALISFSLWLTTQYGISKGEIEIIELEDWNGFEFSEEHSILEVSKIQFRFLKPEHLKQNSQTNLFMKQHVLLDCTNINVGKKVRFKYRSKPLPWAQAETPIQGILNRLGLHPSNVEETLTEYLMPSG
ncbi:hypothetical protein N9Z53_01260 [Mariniblastus sp.]|nr:hypothetical protein [Mariniblastus sp.]MDB4380488.1 hypothetical protein [Mariniblastus sp.]MDC3224316.1 hypothetical protein [Mariniblastus sp.]